MSIDVYESALRLINAATGDPYGDGEIVTNVVSEGYAEPGYGSIFTDTVPVIVFGNWNDKDRYDRETGTWTTLSTVPSRLARALERIGVELEWLDEWTECQGCNRAVRTQADSYSWTPSFAVIDCEILCTDCLLAAGEDAIAEYINEPTKAVTWAGADHLATLGFTRHPNDDAPSYENGWFPGQDARPEPILAHILAENIDAEVVFLIDGVGQFDMSFSAYVRTPDTDEI